VVERIGEEKQEGRKLKDEKVERAGGCNIRKVVR
jgi:hypothetical protein